MALFKVFRGKKVNLPNTLIDGYAYYTTDDGKFYIDAAGQGETLAERKCINPTLVGATATNLGKQGMVPAPAAGQENFVLKGNGQWSKSDFFNGKCTTVVGDGIASSFTISLPPQILESYSTITDLADLITNVFIINNNQVYQSPLTFTQHNNLIGHTVTYQYNSSIQRILLRISFTDVIPVNGAIVQIISLQNLMTI